jgi:hypothetical protein
MRSAFRPFPDLDEDVESDFGLEAAGTDIREGESEILVLSESSLLSDLGLLPFLGDWLRFLPGLLLWLLLLLSVLSGSPEWDPLDRFAGRSSLFPWSLLRVFWHASSTLSDYGGSVSFTGSERPLLIIQRKAKVR